jgi:hypothetical protein
VNATTNPITGTDQKRGAFWSSVKGKFDDLCSGKGLPDDEEKVERTWDALANRYGKKIQPEMNLWLPFYKQILDCPPSGASKEDMLLIATDKFQEHHQRPFKFLHCVEILQQLPKFDPMGVDDEAIDELPANDDGVGNNGSEPANKATTTNKIGKPMGAGMARPMGQKAAKKAAMVDLIEEERTQSLSEIARAQSEIAESVKVATKIEALFTEFRMFKEMGMMEDAKRSIEELQQLKRSSSIATSTVSLAPVSQVMRRQDNDVDVLALDGEDEQEQHKISY